MSLDAADHERIALDAVTLREILEQLHPATRPERRRPDVVVGMGGVLPQRRTLLGERSRRASDERNRRHGGSAGDDLGTVTLVGLHLSRFTFLDIVDQTIDGKQPQTEKRISTAGSEELPHSRVNLDGLSPTCPNTSRNRP